MDAGGPPGQQRNPSSFFEPRTKKFTAKVFFPDGSFKTVSLEKDQTVAELAVVIGRRFEVSGGDIANFFLHEQRFYEDGREEERKLEDSEIVAEVISQWWEMGIADASQLRFKKFLPESLRVAVQMTIPNVNQSMNTRAICRQIRQILAAGISTGDAFSLVEIGETWQERVLDDNEHPLGAGKPGQRRVLLYRRARQRKSLIRVMLDLEPEDILPGVDESRISVSFKVASSTTAADLVEMVAKKLASSLIEGRASEYALFTCMNIHSKERLGRQMQARDNITREQEQLDRHVKAKTAEAPGIVFRNVNKVQRVLSHMQQTESAVRPLKTGWMTKQGHRRKTWRKRWFVLQGQALSYFKSEKDEEPAGVIQLEGARVRVDDTLGKGHCFVIDTMEKGADGQLSEGRSYPIVCVSEGELQEWMSAIRVAKKKESGEETKVTEEDFVLLKVLGKGATGKVMQARHRDTGLVYAVKVMRKDDIVEQGRLEQTRTEWDILKLVNHPFLVQLHYSFQTDERLFLVMDYVTGGELFFHLQREDHFSEDRAKFYAAELILALGHLHKAGIVYRDLKPENILLSEEGHVKLTDFGMCKDKMDFSGSTQTFCGTPEYLAPEVLLQQDYGRAVDWWCLGVTLYEMLVGKHPFYSQDRNAMYKHILQGQIPIPSNLSSEAQGFLRGLLTRDPSKRLGAGEGDAMELQNHSFFADVNWKKLEAREIKPPFRPRVRGRDDASNFDQEFTAEPAVLTYDTRAGMLTDAVQEGFKGFTFVNDSPMGDAGSS